MLSRPASAAVVYDFNTSDLGGATLYGDATVANGALELTHDFNSDGAFLTPDLAPSRFIRAFVANFKVRLIPIGEPFSWADGFSFNWAANLPQGIFSESERGVGNGLSVCFDTFEGPPFDAWILAKWGGNTIATYYTNHAFLPGTNGFADVAIQLHQEGTLDVSYRGMPVFTQLALPGFTPLSNSRFGLGARTGGLAETHTIDDLTLTVDAAIAIMDASSPGDLVMATSSNFPAAQAPAKAIDNDVTTKYLNFDKLNTGLTITPFGKGPVRALTLISAEDAPERDPSSFVLEGSNNGINFTRIASNALPPFVARNAIQSFAVPNSNGFNQYRLRFPTVANAASANSMQIAEVELLYYPEITSPSDAVSITLPPGSVDVRGVGTLFDHQLGPTRKFEVAPISSGNTVVNLTPVAGATLLKGFELIGASDDVTFPQRRPSSVTIEGSNDGTHYMNLATVVPPAPSSNLQIQEFATPSNSGVFTRYRITFGPPVSGDRLQLGELRLFGEVVTSEIAVYNGDTTNAAAARVDGDLYRFSDTPLGYANTATFTIQNLGGAYLSGLALSMAAGSNDYKPLALTATNLAPGATATFSVNFEPASAGNLHFGTVWIANNDPNENPFRIALDGIAPPMQFAQQPADASLCTGDTAQFISEAGPLVSYQWQQKTPGAGAFVDIPGATHPSYSTPPVLPANAGTVFRVRVTKGATTITSREALLSVINVVSSPTVVYDFNNTNLNGATIYGEANVANGVLELNRHDFSSEGAFLTPNLAPGRTVRAFVTNFKVQMASGSGHADGFSFNWATNLPQNVYPGDAERGAGSGLSICFDTFEGGIDEEHSLVLVKWGGATLASTTTNLAFLPGGNDFADVSIRLHREGTVDLAYRCTPIFTGLAIPGFTPLSNSRFGLGARTGGFWETHTIDDLAIEVEAVTDILDGSAPGDLVTATSSNFPAAQAPSKAIDNDVTTKYLNFDKLNSGLIITPTGKRPVQALTLISAEDAPERDPSSFVLDGSNDGINFTRIASNAVPAFPARNFIQSFRFENTNLFNRYRLVFPTVANSATANSMQIAEVELLSWPEISSPNDALSITLPPGAAEVRGVGLLFDRQLALTRKLEVAPISGGNTVVDIVPAAGATILKGFEMIGAADDFTYPQRRPSSVMVAGSIDGIHYTSLSTVVPAAPTSNLQIQEFSTSSNAMAFTQYRITFGPPASGDRLQLGEMRLFGETASLPPTLTIRIAGNSVLISWPDVPGFVLESKTALQNTNWSTVTAVPALNNGVKTVTWINSGTATFFRLRK